MSFAAESQASWLVRLSCNLGVGVEREVSAQPPRKGRFSFERTFPVSGVYRITKGPSAMSSTIAREDRSSS